MNIYEVFFMSDKNKMNRSPQNKKQQQLDKYRISNKNKPMTTNVGRKISNDEEQLKVGPSVPSLREDHQYLEKMTHFVKEEIPQRVVRSEERRVGRRRTAEEERMR